MNQFNSTIRAAIIALATTALMLLVRQFVFIPLFGFGYPLLPAMLVVIMSAAIGGLCAGLFATILNVVLLTIFYHRVNGVEIAGLQRFVLLFLFVVVNCAISWGFEALHAARRGAEDRRCALETEMRRASRPKPSCDSAKSAFAWLSRRPTSAPGTTTPSPASSSGERRPS